MKTFDISIAGEINLDLILYGLPSVMPLERELLASDFQATLGSSSAILAHNLSVLGTRVAFLTRAGADPFGAIALDWLKESGADLSRVVFDRDGVSTGVTVLLHHGGERHILTYPGTMSEMSAHDLDIEYLKEARHFHLSSLFLQRALAPDLPDLFRELKSAGLTLSLDTNDDPENQWGGVLDEVLGLVDILLPNEVEACKIAKADSLEEALAWLEDRVPCVAVKRGPAGALVSCGGKRIFAPPLFVTPIDTIGAGDSFNAGFLYAWLRGLPLEECARCGNIAGALSTQRPGGTEAFRDHAFAQAFLAKHSFPLETPKPEKNADKFVAMVSATAEISLPLGRFQPRTTLVRAEHTVERARFPVIDYHNHLDSVDPLEVLRVMDACGIERIVNITMQTGREALRMIEKFHAADAGRFATIGWMDWSRIQEPDFVQVALDSLEELVECGAKGIKFWKDLGLTIRDASGELVRIDDDRLAPVFAKAAQLGIPVMFHTADPDAFFLPLDEHNERYEELAAHPDWSFYGAQYAKKELLDQRDRVIARHPETTFVCAHVAECGEDLARATSLLERFANVSVDISARASELGRQPYAAREFFLRFSDRILFGADLLPEESMYRLYFRFLESADEYFDYPSHASRQGRWKIYGLHLPDDVLRKVYRENALRLLA